MQLNLHAAIALITYLALGVTVLVTAIRWVRRTHPGYHRWAIAGLLLVLSLFLLSLRSAPTWIRTISANTGIALASILYLEGAREFRGLSPRNWLAYAGGAVTIGVVAFSSYIVPSMNSRAAVMSTFLAVVFTLVSITLLQGIGPTHRFGLAFTGSMFALCAATLLVRAFYCWFGPPMTDWDSLSGIHSAFFFATVVEMSAFSVGLGLLADERVISALNEVRERASSAGTEVNRLIEAQALLRESEERFRRVFEEGPLGLALVGKNHRFLKVNSALCQMTGYTEAELVQKTFAEITHPDDVRADIELADRLFRREIPFYRMQKRYVKKTGEILWINLTASMIHGPDGEPLHRLGMIEDITELKRSQEEALLRQKLESVGTLAGGIAHDFNNLLSAVQAQAELALEALKGGASCTEELKAISKVAMRGSEIVRQLLIYAGKDDAVDGPVDLSKTVDEMLSLLKASVTKHAVIKADLDESLPVVRANAAQIRQIIMNLITNASDAIDGREGVIRVITRRVALAKAAANASGTLSQGDYVQLEVSDTGCGMSPETQAKVFDPFFTTKSAGRGLGLAVVQGVVRSLGGTIDLTSEPDKGTKFRILLRAETTAGVSNHADTGAVEMALPSQHGTILVVEDEDYLRQAIVRMLQKNGFEAMAVGDGTAAIDILRADGARVDVILLDMTIPGASSREIVAESANVKPNIKVILTSAYSQEAIADAMTQPQVQAFIRKPFELGDLLKNLRSCLSSTVQKTGPRS